MAGLTLCGGEPMLNAAGLVPLVRRVRHRAAGEEYLELYGLPVETLVLFGDARAELVSLLDVVIDGQYIAELRDEGALLPFRGSSNQRLIDVAASLGAGRAVEWELAGVDRPDRHFPCHSL